LLNNDIVGGTLGTDGRKVDNIVRVFSEGIRASEDLPAQMARRNSGGEDGGPSRMLMGYIKGIGGSSGLNVFGVERPDRFSRGGDHLPALELGFPAVRFTVGVENYHHQHQDLRTENGIEYGDTVDKMDFEYLAKVTRLNILTASYLSLAPPSPESATLSGAVSSDTKVSWTPVKGGGVTGYMVYYRRAEEGAQWKPAPFVEGANASETVLKGIIVDDHFFAVAAMGKNLSVATFAGLPPRN
jgi:hypothetical protein